MTTIKQVRLDIRWMWHPDLEEYKDHLRSELREYLMGEVDDLMQTCMEGLYNGAPEILCTTQAEYTEMKSDTDERVYAFIGVTANMEMPSHVVIYLATTKEDTQVMGEAWDRACIAGMGAPLGERLH